MKQQSFFAALLCAVIPFAQAATDTLDEVVVTATRLEQPLSQSLSHVTVLDAEQIGASGATDLPTLLRRQAGLEITQAGGVGAQSSLFTRGSNSNHTLILLDGVRMSSATTGATAIDQIMLDQIERIEIVRGNVSSLYGSDAIGGVIQIFTRRGHGAPAFNASAQAGSHNTQRASAGFGTEVDDNRFNLQASAFRTDGVSAINPAIAPSANPNNNGYDNQSLSGNLSHRFDADNSVSAALFASQGRISTDNAFGFSTADLNDSKSNLAKLALSSDNRLSENWSSHVQFAQGSDDTKTFLNGVSNASYRTTNRQIGWQNNVAFGETGQLMLGVDQLEQRVASSTLYSRDSRRVNSLYGGYTGLYSAHQAQLNLRQDRYSDFGTANTGLLGYGYRFNDDWRASASYSTAFRAPTFNDLYWPAAWGYQGNANLKPERSRNLELGVHYAVTDQHLDVMYFDNRIRELIDPGTTMPVNLNQARIDGLELGYGAQFGETALATTLTAQNPRDAVTGQRLIRRAKRYGNVSVSRTLSAWKLGGEVRFSDAREDNHLTAWPAQRVTLPGYAVLNLSAGYALDQRLQLSLRVDNLFNRDVSLLHGYNTPGRTLMIGLNYQ